SCSGDKKYHGFHRTLQQMPQEGTICITLKRPSSKLKCHVPMIPHSSPYNRKSKLGKVEFDIDEGPTTKSRDLPKVTQGQSAHQPLELKTLGGKQEGQKSCGTDVKWPQFYPSFDVEDDPARGIMTQFIDRACRHWLYLNPTLAKKRPLKEESSDQKETPKDSSKQGRKHRDFVPRAGS
ncbi:hypothetical protein STEG23_010567, partial [Scotinomys teguina]